MALTDAAIRARKPATKPYTIYDRGGLFLLVNPSGSKLWRWRYGADGKEKLMALGEYPTVNLAAARERHFAARKKLAAGIDPIAERKAKAVALELIEPAMPFRDKAAFQVATRGHAFANATAAKPIYRMMVKPPTWGSMRSSRITSHSPERPSSSASWPS
ncbi:MAG: Arm DNA-binding domain-containing protein [Terracidiphilus sp.]|jgi:hypothetical protein